ncbi:hypothetical protein PanWU01x14_062070 [Parasponia andersonii]|uniref:Uncharacterized protein n=1 Tax=Parasponia andersonii TaxID=3476 RepID=A0A2P5DHF4_PARAD|nr:hypothetical protein PanWU01x14_062070 [Parasponia andersonii]
MRMKRDILGAKRLEGADEVLVFDCGKLEDVQDEYYDGLELRLIGEGDVGEGLAYDPRREGYILSASLAHNISLWDLSAPSRRPKTLSPVHVFGGSATFKREKKANLMTKVGLPQSTSTGVCCLRFWSKRGRRTGIFLLFVLVKNGKAGEEGERVCKEES